MDLGYFAEVQFHPNPVATMNAPTLPSRTHTLLCTALLFALTLIQSGSLQAQTPMLAPQITELSFDTNGDLKTEVAIPPGFRYALLEVYDPSGTWEPMIAGPLTGASGTVTFTYPTPGLRSIVRVQTGDSTTVPPSTLSGSQYFEPTYGDGGTYIDGMAEFYQVLNRVGYGPSGSSLTKIMTMGTEAYITEQLNPDTIDESGNTQLNDAVDALFYDYLPFSGDELISQGAAITYFKGLSEPPATWKDSGFDDSGWDTGVTGIGYGDDDDATVLADMQGGYSTFYVRADFNVADVNDVETMLLNIIYDDGFVAYLNGTEIARFNTSNGGTEIPAGTPVPFDAETNNGGFENGDPATFDISTFKSELVNGTNTSQCRSSTLA